MPGEHLLVVDDEENLRTMLCAALRHNEFEVSSATNGREGLAAISEHKPDLVVLDVMMPDLDGFEVCRRMRAENDQTPVLFLTASDSTQDKVRGLRLGADDYLEKPFSLEELVARAHSILRRTNRSTGSNRIIELDDVQMDLDAHLVVKSGKHVHLSPTEYELLKYLLENQGKVLSKPQILRQVWGYDFETNGGVVETYIGYLRKKLDTNEPKLIHTVRGAGYTMRIQPT